MRNYINKQYTVIITNLFYTKISSGYTYNKRIRLCTVNRIFLNVEFTVTIEYIFIFLVCKIVNMYECVYLKYSLNCALF